MDYLSSLEFLELNDEMMQIESGLFVLETTVKISVVCEQIFNCLPNTIETSVI